jgi:hypothetical protein
MHIFRSSDLLQQGLVEALSCADLTLGELWLRYLALAGTGDRLEVEGYLLALMTMDHDEHDLLAAAVNDWLDELGCPVRAPYAPPCGAPGFEA